MSDSGAAAADAGLADERMNTHPEMYGCTSDKGSNIKKSLLQQGGLNVETCFCMGHDCHNIMTFVNSCPAVAKVLKITNKCATY